MSKKKYIKIEVPKFTWWQLGIVCVALILASKSSTSVTGLIELIGAIKELFGN